MLRILRRILPAEPVLFDSESAREGRIAWNEARLSAALDALPPLAADHADDDAGPCLATGPEILEHPPRRSPLPRRIKPWRERLVDQEGTDGRQVCDAASPR